MGYRGFVRSLGAAVRQAERDSIRRQRLLEKQRIAYEKMQALEQAAFDVDEYENKIERLITLHKDCLSGYEWKEISRKEKPKEPNKNSRNEEIARLKISSYKPNIIDKILKLESKKREKLDNNLKIAIRNDQIEYDKQMEDYKQILNDHNELITMANRVLDGDIEAYKEVVKEFEPLSEISEIGLQVEFSFISKDKLKVSLSVHGDSIIPRESKSLLKSGKLSVKEMPIGKYNELYQDHVCSASLRVARELFGLLPLSEIIVNSKTRLLNTVNGKLEMQPILSVRFLKETLENINFENIDPSDSMKNFIHRMGFKKSQGMSVIEELEFV